MKKVFTVLLVVLTFTTQAQVKNILFLGNSYTYVNNLPQLIKDVALSFGDTVVTDQNTPGGYQLNQHVTNSTTLSKIASQNWDNVIIQEQSQLPSFSPGQVSWQVYPHAQTLCDSIRANYSCSEPVFYMTWGRKNSDSGPCSSGLTSSCTYEGMQQRLRESYMEMAADNNATTSPVGVAWKNVRDSFPSIELYSGDESHPSIYGSYLAACVFYATLYQKSPIGSTYIPSGINAIDALNLQTTASYTVLDSLPLWRINANKPVADFNYTGNGTINFNNTSTNDVSYSWDFGDGNTSTLENPSNTYPINNTYPVQLIIYSTDSCFSDTITQNIIINTTGINDLNNDNEFIIYPNPATDFIEIKTNMKYNYVSIMDITGKTVKQVNTQSKIDISDLTNGIYFINVIGNENPIIRKFVKE